MKERIKYKVRRHHQLFIDRFPNNYRGYKTEMLESSPEKIIVEFSFKNSNPRIPDNQIEKMIKTLRHHQEEVEIYRLNFNHTITLHHEDKE